MTGETVKATPKGDVMVAGTWYRHEDGGWYALRTDRDGNCEAVLPEMREPMSDALDLLADPVRQAAPELLEALQALVAAIPAADREGDLAHDWLKARAAIAKATGADTHADARSGRGG